MREAASHRLRRLVPLVLGWALIAAPAASAHPPAPVNERGAPIKGEVHTWLHRANVPLVRGRIRVLRADCPGVPLFVACVYTARPRTLYLEAGIRAPRLVFYHELGHVFDLLVLNGRERRRFKRIAGIRASGWYGGRLPPSEWFADAYAACAANLRLWRRAEATAYGYRPSRRAHRRACLLIRRAAAPRGRPPRPAPSPPPVIEVAPPPPAETQPDPADPGCNLVEQLVTGCAPSPAPAPAPAPPVV